MNTYTGNESGRYISTLVCTCSRHFGALHQVPSAGLRSQPWGQQTAIVSSHSPVVPTLSKVSSWAFSEVRGAFLAYIKSKQEARKRRGGLSNNGKDGAHGQCPNILSFEWTVLGGFHYNSLHLPHVHMTHSRNLDDGHSWCCSCYTAHSFCSFTPTFKDPSKINHLIQVLVSNSVLRGTQTKMTHST